MKNRAFLLFILVTILLSSCKKGGPQFLFEGKIFALHNNDIVEGVNIEIYSVKLGSAFETKLTETQSDANGNYSVSITRGKYEKIIIKLQKDKFFSGTTEYGLTELTTAKANKIDFHLSPISELKLSIKNIYSYRNSDEFKIQKVGGKTGCDGCWENQAYLFHGRVDETISILNDGDTYFTYYYWLNGDELSGKDSVFCSAFETVEKEIIY